MTSKYFLILLFTCCNTISRAQYPVSGTVYDNTKVNYVENVRVVSTGGMFAVTDSLGHYSIIAEEKDSLTFFYNNKPTQKFSVAAISDPQAFDISLHITVQGKYHALKEVIVHSRSYKEDSLENRQTYADIYDYKKPGIRTNMQGGVAGADLDELINIFRFKRNRQLRAFQERLELEEQDKYVDYRFSKIIVRRITGLQSPVLDTFLVRYRPSYDFTRNSDELSFNQYILNSYYQFKKLFGVAAKKEEH